MACLYRTWIRCEIRKLWNVLSHIVWNKTYNAIFKSIFLKFWILINLFLRLENFLGEHALQVSSSCEFRKRPYAGVWNTYCKYGAHKFWQIQKFFESVPNENQFMSIYALFMNICELKITWLRAALSDTERNYFMPPEIACRQK